MLYLEFVLRLALAFAFGALIGMERQWRQKLAGLRTNCLVSMGAALFVMLAALLPGDSSPSRIAAQVVSGIGFLGAGVIIRDGVNVRGLNTAATLWCSAAVGSLCGEGFYVQGGLGALAVVLANLVLRPLARKIERNSPASEEEVCYSFSCVCRTADEAHVRALLLQAIQLQPLSLAALDSEDLPDMQSIHVRAELRSLGRQDRLLEQLVSRLSLEASVTKIRWEVRDSSVPEFAPSGLAVT
ncbi:MAG: MgtC/SapB family protein [Bryobacteraceae bacterium]|nr:MgtC/SapB family protein [Bryobacteraceae bacterium]MDW8377317.1 MgtC/SapB family protein [Bryobacterales bacterium]